LIEKRAGPAAPDIDVATMNRRVAMTGLRFSGPRIN
jgi:hypothetical protein